MKRMYFLIGALVLAVVLIIFFWLGPGTIKADLSWILTPDSGDEIYGPRKEYMDKAGLRPDDGTIPPNSTPTGTILFGPLASGGGIGNINSVATTEFECGNGAICEVRVFISTLGSANPDERMRIIAEGGNGRDSISHSAVDPSRSYVMRIPGCGKVKVSAFVAETVSSQNPEGINSRMSMRVEEYRCTDR